MDVALHEDELWTSGFGERYRYSYFELFRVGTENDFQTWIRDSNLNLNN